MTKVTVGGGSSVHLRGTIKPGLEDVIEGTNVTIDKTDPKNPIISSTGGGGSMVYPGSGIPLSTGSAWGTSITDNSANWNAAYGWGDHASAGYLTSLTNGNGTTVNGTGDGVDLGGATSANYKVGGEYDQEFERTESLTDVPMGSGWNSTIRHTYKLQSTGFLLDSDFSNDGGFFGSRTARLELKLNTPIDPNSSTSFYEWIMNAVDSYSGRTASMLLGPYTTSLGLSNIGVFFNFNSNSGSIKNSFDNGFGFNNTSVWLGDVTSFSGAKFGYDATGSVINLGSDASQDLYKRNGSGYFTRIPVGSNGDVLTVTAGSVGWAAPSGGGLTVGTSTITSGTNTRVLYNNSGVLGEYTVSGSGNVAMTTSPTFTTPDIGTATGTASGDWHLTGTSTLTGASTIVGTSSNTNTFQYASLATSTTPVFTLENPTAAAAGAQQFSPFFRQRARGWKTNSTAASQTVDFDFGVTPVQAAAAPTGYWSLWSSINGGSKSENVRFTNTGLMFLTGGTGFSAGIFFGTAGDLQISRSISGAQGLNIYGPASAANIYTLNIAGTSNHIFTSGTGGSLGLPGNFAPTSGSGNFYVANATGTINMTGTSSGNVFGYGNNQTITAAKGNYTGFYHNPSVTSITGNHLSFHAVSGNMLLPASSYININSTVGSSGYGFRDNAGTMEYKNSGGAWLSITGDASPQSNVTNYKMSLVGFPSGTSGTLGTPVTSSQIADGESVTIVVHWSAKDLDSNTGAGGTFTTVWTKASGTLNKVFDDNSPAAGASDTGDTITVTSTDSSGDIVLTLGTGTIGGNMKASGFAEVTINK